MTAPPLDGASMGALWAAPFAGLLLCIAALPLLAPHLWHRFQEPVLLAFGAAAALPLVLLRGEAGAHGLLHALIGEYVPFVLLLLALYTVAGGIAVRGNLHGSPLTNAALITVGAVLASFVGTTGASMVMVRPLIRANDDRRHNAHVVVFFIFLASNIGGGLTPVGDPPLFLGYLRGVDFSWTIVNLWPEVLTAYLVVLGVFLVVDTLIYRREGVVRPDPTPDSGVRVTGLVNLPLAALVVGAILLSAQLKLGEVDVLGVPVTVASLVRDALFLLATGLSLALTKRDDREANGFTFAPMREVAVLFVAVFAALVPVMAMLKAGSGGAFAPLVALVARPDGAPSPVAYFWATGLLSGFLDNAPTYLVFFELAGGDAKRLMTEGAPVLAAVSCGAVFMGALSYIGNAPNLMVAAIARERGVEMPSFLGYMAWSGAVLLPTFALITLLFFRGT